MKHRYGDGKEIKTGDISTSTKDISFTKLFYAAVVNSKVLCTSLLSTKPRNVEGKTEHLRLIMRQKEWEKLLHSLLDILERRNIDTINYTVPIEAQEVWISIE